MSIKIAVLHASYQRVAQTVECFTRWIEAADNPKQVEYFIALDSVDPAVPEYIKLFATAPILKSGRFVIDVGDSTDGVKATHRVSKSMSSTTEILFRNAEDIYPCEHWDTQLIQAFSQDNNFVTPRSLAVHDGFWDMPTTFVYAIANRALYNKLGFLICPEYHSMYSDNDFYEVCNKLGCIIQAPHITFLHKHYGKGVTPFDPTYARTNSAVEMDKGLQILIARRARNFDL